METSFENFYDKFDKTEFEEPWNKYKEAKKKARHKGLIGCAIIDVFLVIFFSCVFIAENLSVLSLIVFLIFIIGLIDVVVIGIIELSSGSKYQIEYGRLYKAKLINGMLNNFFSDVTYFPYNSLNKDIYDGGLYNEYYNEYNSDDGVEAVIDNKNAIRFAEVHTVDVQTHRDSNGHTRTTRTTKFHGLFAQINIDSNLNCPIRIRTHDYWKNRREVEMDSNEFQKYFDVESEDRIKAMQFLTHDVMEELISFRKYLGSAFDIWITGRHIYIRLHVGYLFESVIDKNEVIYKGQAEKYFNILQFFYNLSKKIIAISEDNKF